jgi:3-methyladenine DNA glycosylase/8-oxoguanine DNA glycosylase
MTAVIAAAPARLARRSTDIGATLSWYRHGGSDPTTWLTTVGRGPDGSGHFVRATLTPDGPGTVSLRWAQDDITVETYGPGGAWLQQQAERMIGSADTDDHGLEASDHPVVAAAARANRHLRIGASSDLYHELLPIIIEQRITAGEAHRQWQRLCFELSEPAPGPFTRLLLPPDPAVLARRPSWWFHPLGIERKRAEPLINVARHASKFWTWSAMGPQEATTKLRLIRGVGQWTIGSVLGPALGDPDAVAVGDFHLKNLIAHNLAGEARGTDERMLELLEPYAGQRGRVVRYVARQGSVAPKFGPKKRIMAMHAW